MTPTVRDHLIAGLRKRGWTPHPSPNTAFLAFRHPDKGARTLWVGASNALRVGPTPKSAEPVNLTFKAQTIALGQQ